MQNKKHTLTQLKQWLRPVSDYSTGKNVAQQIAAEANTVISKNRAKLLSILKTVIFCARQNIALRGHRHESGWTPESSEHPCENPGNFLALLRFRADSGDKALLEHFEVSRRTTYQSPQIQNEMIQCTGNWVRDQILSEVREQPFFSISADEAVDCSNKEQMPFVIRFVDSSDNIREEFLDFILCDQGTTGEAIARKLTQELDVLSLKDFLSKTFEVSATMEQGTWQDV